MADAKQRGRPKGKGACLEQPESKERATTLFWKKCGKLVKEVQAAAKATNPDPVQADDGETQPVTAWFALSAGVEGGAGKKRVKNSPGKEPPRAKLQEEAFSLRCGTRNGELPAFDYVSSIFCAGKEGLLPPRGTKLTTLSSEEDVVSLFVDKKSVPKFLTPVQSRKRSAPCTLNCKT